jgi:hypothetical protein
LRKGRHPDRSLGSAGAIAFVAERSSGTGGRHDRGVVIPIARVRDVSRVKAIVSERRGFRAEV